MKTKPTSARKVSPTGNGDPSSSQSTRRMLIDGQWVASASGETFPTYDPATGKVICLVAGGGKPEVDRAVKAARKAFESGAWPGLTPSERGKLLWKLADLLEQNLEELAWLESLDNGKPLAVARVADVPLAIDLFRYMAEIGRAHV